jgi:hypothetical protein
LTREARYNGVVATSAPQNETDPVLRAVAVETTGPLQWDGPYGRRPRYYSSPLLTTQAQVQQAADSSLALQRGRAVKVEWDAVPNPALEPLDVVALLRPGGVPVPCVLMDVTVPLGLGQAQHGLMVPTDDVGWLE